MTDLSQSSFYGDDDQRLAGPKGDKGDIGPQGPPGPSFSFASLPEHPDNSAALADGLEPGDPYKTPTGEVRVVV